MGRYLSHISAANFWRVPCLETVLGSQAGDGAEKEKQHFTFASSDVVCYRKDFVSHLHRLPLPTGAVVSRNGIKVASPELTFLQLAHILSIQRLILLGLQLCSHPPGKAEMAIMTKQKLKNFIGQTGNHIGHRKATRALQYVENGSASVMESLSFMILSLPHALGGFALDRPVFNYEIKLKNEGKERFKQSRCFADLYYTEAKLAVEYDSFAYHNSPTGHGRDALRAGILKRQGIEVLSLNTIQLYNVAACRDFAYNLAGHIGKRLQIRTEKFEAMHAELRALLP